MNNQLIRPYLGRVSIFGLVVAALLSACSKPKPVDPATVAPAQYKLQTIRYFFNQGDRVDTTTLQLKGSQVQNPSAVLSTQQIEAGFGELVKTSLFVIDPTSQVPTEVDLSRFDVSVPQHWYGNGLFDRSIETYPLSPIEQHKLYGFDPKGSLTVKIPPKSKLDISRQIIAYQLICSFDGVVENTTTGQQYSLRGKWKGLLQYGNPTTTLKESAL